MTKYGLFERFFGNPTAKVLFISKITPGMKTFTFISPISKLDKVVI